MIVIDAKIPDCNLGQQFYFGGTSPGSALLIDIHLCAADTASAVG
jgi:hypothetical protein